MSAKFKAVSRGVAALAAIGATVSWTFAACEALPRLTAGPLCSARSDIGLLGHCPACPLALSFSALFLIAAVFSPRSPRLAPQRIPE